MELSQKIKLNQLLWGNRLVEISHFRIQNFVVIKVFLGGIVTYDQFDQSCSKKCPNFPVVTQKVAATVFTKQVMTFKIA